MTSTLHGDLASRMMSQRGPVYGRGPGEPWAGIVEETPQLWSGWITDLCKRIGRPLPSTIDVDGQAVQIVTATLTFGERPYFLCPRCGRRVEVVYLPPDMVGCRRCCRLGYRSQQHRQGSVWRELDGLMIEAESPQPFGVGLGHVYGNPDLDGFMPEEFDVPAGLQEVFEVLRKEVEKERQRSLWMRPADDILDDDLTPDAIAGEGGYRDGQQYFVQEEQRLAALFRDQRLSTTQCNEYLAADTLNWFRFEFTDTITQMGLPPDQFSDMDANELIALILAIPTANVTYQLRCLRHQNPQLPVKPNDMEDLAWIPPAVVYCDVVVMEKHWHNFLLRAKLDGMYGTKVLARLEELAPILDVL